MNVPALMNNKCMALEIITLNGKNAHAYAVKIRRSELP